MLKWLKKVKNWLQGEEIIEIEEVIIDDSMELEELKLLSSAKHSKQSNHKSTALQRENVQNSNPDTKVLYQYPKGKFKFPLIPDEQSLPKRKPSERMRQEKQPQVSVRQRSKPVVIEPKEVTPKPERKISSPKKPFRLTEIPSPIYGFQRPKTETDEQAVEFELETKPTLVYQRERELEVPVFLRKNKQQEEPSTPELAQKQVSAKEIVQPVAIEEEKVVVKGPAAVEEEKAEVQEPAAVVEEKIEVQEPTLAFEEEIEVKEPAAVVEGRGEARESALAFEEKAEVQEPAAVVEEEVEAQESAAVVEEKAEVQEPAVVVEEEVEAQESAAVVEEKAEVQEPAAVVEEEVEVQEPALAFEEKGELAQSVNANSTNEASHVLEENRVKETVDKKEEQSRKKHIPFNVVMLKQDHKRSNLPSFKDSEKKTEFFRKESTSEAVAKEPIVEREQEAKEKENVSEAKSVEIAQQTVMVEALVEENIEEQESTEENPYYVFPDIELLTPPTVTENDEEWLTEQTTLLDETLLNFNVRARVVNVTQGPAVTRFEVQPEPGVKVNKVTNLMDDIKLSLAAQDIRMEAPIPGKHTIGIEIPNRSSKPVFLREVLESEVFQNHPSPLAVAMGLDISGQPLVTDLRKMPHGLIAGQTGSGKSVCINTMLVSLLYKATPQELKLMLIDPKMVELAPYNRIPHLVSPVITDVKAATAALKWAVEEMERRYDLFVHAGVRDITKFNERAEHAGQYANELPYIVIIIDELADLMMMSPADVEEAICRIAQKARACGIHLIVATQRPSVDVITGLIKANIPTRVAFSVSSQVDSRTIIDSGGAEKLLGRGDMLFAENGSSKTIRLQGTFVSDDEIDQVVGHVKNEQQPNYLFQQEELLNRAQVSEETDELFFEACEFVVSQHSASTSSIQRRFRVGYNRAARLIEMMEQRGIISESRGSKPRDVLISEDELEYFTETNMHMN